MIDCSGSHQRMAAVAAALMALLLPGCASLGGDGPSSRALAAASTGAEEGAGIALLALDERVVAALARLERAQRFSESFGDAVLAGPLIGPGDVLDITLWEAPPAVLFGPGQGVDGQMPAAGATIPQQMVGTDGTITVPFAGTLAVAGKTPQQVEQAILARLAGRAHDPQAVVRLIQNEARTATVIGEVGASRRVALSARGVRVLDALAEAGGPREDSARATVQLTRGGRTATMPLARIIADPAENVALLPGDVVAVLSRPFSFVAMGALRQPAEIAFEGSGLTLAQALGRTGGLRDDRADIRGVFLFRFEDPAALPPAEVQAARALSDGRVPVIYRLDLSDPASFFTAQEFAMRDGDIIYVSTAPGADLQRFLGALSSVIFSAATVGNAIR